jgi:hypothetical protein
VADRQELLFNEHDRFNSYPQLADMNSKMKTPAKPAKPRVLVPFNTGTRPHKTKKGYRRIKKGEVME